MINRRSILSGAALLAAWPAIRPAAAADTAAMATGGLGLVVEGATGSLLVVDRINRTAIGRIEGLGDLSHASLTYSPDERFAYVFGRDGGLTKVDMLTRSIAGRVVQAGSPRELVVEREPVGQVPQDVLRRRPA